MIMQRSNTAMRIYMTIVACVTWFALLLQFSLTIATTRANGMTVIAGVVAYFSFSPFSET